MLIVEFGGAFASVLMYDSSSHRTVWVRLLGARHPVEMKEYEEDMARWALAHALQSLVMGRVHGQPPVNLPAFQGQRRRPDGWTFEQLLTWTSVGLWRCDRTAH